MDVYTYTQTTRPTLLFVSTLLFVDAVVCRGAVRELAQRRRL